jgi:hypothetical protein
LAANCESFVAPRGRPAQPVRKVERKREDEALEERGVSLEGDQVFEAETQHCVDPSSMAPRPDRRTSPIAVALRVLESPGIPSRYDDFWRSKWPPDIRG